MTAALTLTALLCLFSLPLYGYFYISPKIQNPQTAETVPYLCLLPSFALFGLAMYLEQPEPLTLSSAGGTVQRYTVQKTRHSKSFERIAVSWTAHAMSGISALKPACRASARGRESALTIMTASAIRNWLNLKSLKSPIEHLSPSLRSLAF